MRRWAAQIAAVILLPSAAISQTSQGSQGDCAPVINHTTGNVTINIVCGLSKAALKENAVDALQSVSSNLRAVVATSTARQQINRNYLLPALEDYIQRPSPGQWAVLQRHAQRSQQYLEAAIDAVIAYDVSLKGVSRPILDRLHSSMYNRTRLLASLRDEPMSPNEAREWAQQYKRLLDQTAEDVDALQNRVAESK